MDKRADVYHLDVTYDTPVDGIRKIYTAKFEFPIQPFDLHSDTTINASSREESEGDSESGSNEIDEMIKHLDSPIGTIIFKFPESQPNGQPNFLVISDGPNRQILINPIKRVIHFSMISGGRVYGLQRPFLAPRNGLHWMGATWDDMGNVHLYVDLSK